MGGTTGGHKVSPILQTAVEMCEDGQWRDLEVVIRELSKMVSPGPAMRRVEKTRLHQGGPPERYKPIETDRAVVTGKRSIVKDSLKSPWFEIDPPGRVVNGTPRRIRLLMVPLSMQQARKREHKRALKVAPKVGPEEVVKKLLKEDVSDEILMKLSAPELRSVIHILANKIRKSEARWLEW